jgi:diguanylate cyclase (GGDEF)-like protein/PAS domain S-box-containing protein
MPHPAEANLSALIESTEDLIWSVDLDYRLITFNQALRQNIWNTYGIQIAAEMRFHDLFPPQRAALWPSFYSRALAQGTFRVEYSLRDGRTLELAFNPIVADGEKTGVSVFGKDITNYKRTTEALAESEARLRKFFESNGSVMLFLDPASGEITGANQAAVDYYGYALDQLIGMSINRINAQPALEIFSQCQQALRKERVHFEFRHRLASGEERDVEVYCSPIQAGDRTLLFSIVHDITERKAAESALREAEKKYRDIFEGALEGMCRVSLEGKFLAANPAAARILGYDSADELLSMVKDLAQDMWLNPKERDHYMEMLAEHGSVRGFECQFKRKDGAPVWVSLRDRRVCDGDGRLLYLEGFMEDITERKLTEMQLRNSEERYRATFEQAAMGIVHSSFEGRILRCNTRFAAIVGYPPEVIPGMTVEQLTAPEDRAESIETLRRISSGAVDTISFEKRFARPDASLTWAKLTVSMQRDGEGRALHFMAFVEDISARKASEERLAATSEALRLSEERYRIAFQTSIDAMSLSHLESGRFVDANPAFVYMFGYEREDIVGRTSMELHMWTDTQDRKRLVDALRKEPDWRDMEFQFARKSGERFWALVSASRIELDGIPSFLLVMRDISDAKAAAEALRVSEARYHTAFQTSFDGIAISQMSDGRYLDANKAFLDLLGFEREEFVGRTSLELNLWADAGVRQEMVAELRERAGFRDMQTQFVRKCGEIIWVLISASAIEIDGVPCILSVVRDITEEKAAGERLAITTDALRVSEERYRIAFQTSIDAININRLSDGKYVDVNQSFLDSLGYEREEVLGRTSLELGIWESPSDRQSMMAIVLQNSSCRGLEARFRKKNGELIWGEMSASVIEIDGVPCILSITRDITAAKAVESTIRSLAFYDSLTGLPNRRQLLEQLRLPMAAGGRSDRLQALLLIDMDHLKIVNDTLGHQAGDLLLKDVARRVAASVHEGDTVCRMGGDEFVVLLENLSEVAEEAAAQAKAVGEHILAAIDRPYSIESRDYLLTASIGITVFGERKNSTDEVLQQADIALDQAKAAGRNTQRFFSPALQDAVNARASLEVELRQAIRTNQFLLCYQPQVKQGRLTGAEALIRWNHPSRGIVMPDDFIPLAEESRLILSLGDWILEAACAQIAAWAGRDQTAHLTVAVNISALQFRQPEFVEQVLTTLERTGANPKNLELELTESMLVEDIEEVIAKMIELKSHGLSFSLDDFGTGYSSLSYLKRLPLDCLKIDRSFVRDMLEDAASGAIAATIVSLGRAMGIPVIAEGVEREEQRGYLAGLGCHSFQGFLFSPPLPLEQFEAFVKNSPMSSHR